MQCLGFINIFGYLDNAFMVKNQEVCIKYIISPTLLFNFTLCVCGHEGSVVRMCMLKDNLLESVLSFHHVDSGVAVDVLWLGAVDFCLLTIWLCLVSFNILYLCLF